MSPDGGSVYVTIPNQFGTGNQLAQYSVGPNGALTPMSPATVTTGADPEGVAVSPDGKSVYVINAGDGTVSQFSVGPGGRLSPLSPATVTTSSGPSVSAAVAVSPDSGSVYVANGGAVNAGNKVSQFDVGSGGALTPKDPATVDVAPDGVPYGPSGLVVSPDGTSVYVTDLSDAFVSQFSVGAGGLLSGGAVVPTDGGPIGIAMASGVVLPAVTAVSPASGPSSGGTPITITGTGFASGDTVEIGQGSGTGSSAIPASDVTVVSPTEITATTGGGAKPGTFNLFVVRPDGMASRALGATFSYGQIVTGVSPSSGSVNGGTSITITGSGFESGASLEIAQARGLDATAIPATDVNVVSPTEITAVTGGGAKAGTWDVFVTENGQASRGNAAAQFTYTAPMISGVSPGSGTAAGETPITIAGSGFEPGSTVSITQARGLDATAIPATDVDVVSPTEITAVTGGPAKPGTWVVYVIDGAATSPARAAPRFTYTVPSVTAVSPSSGPTSGGTGIAIFGSGFSPGATVEIAQGHGAGPTAIQATDVQVISPTEITAVTSGPAKPGTFYLFVTSDGSTSKPNKAVLYTYTHASG